MMSRRAARGQKLPPQEVEYLNSLPKDLMIFRVKLLFDEGWPLDAIGESFPQTRTRSTIRSWVVRAGETLDLDAESVFIDAPIPTPRLKTSDDGYQKVKPESPKIRLNDLEQIQLLAPQARTFRSRMASTSAPAVANQRLTTLCKKLYQDKVGIKDLAEAAGVTYRAMYKRIKL
jgi:hypothetical protein